MIHHPAVLAFVVCLGACIGSFLNVVIYRVPRNLSVNKPARSFCPSCEKQIPFYYNIPILSWIMLRGKCAFCKAPISARYVVVEAVTMLFFLVIWLKFAPLLGWGVAVMLWVLISLLLAASFIDYEHQIIPDSINYGGALVAVVFAAALPLLDNRFPYLGLLHVPPGTDQLPNAIWYRGILWSVVGAGMGYLLIWSVVNLGKLAFGRKVHEYEEDQDWVIHQPNPDENPRLEIGESEHYYWEDLFNRPSDKLVIETSKVTFHLKDSETQETTVKEVKTEDFIVQNNILQAGGESIKLEGVLRIDKNVFFYNNLFYLKTMSKTTFF